MPVTTRGAKQRKVQAKTIISNDTDGSDLNYVLTEICKMPKIEHTNQALEEQGISTPEELMLLSGDEVK